MTVPDCALTVDATSIMKLAIARPLLPMRVGLRFRHYALRADRRLEGKGLIRQCHRYRNENMLKQDKGKDAATSVCLSQPLFLALNATTSSLPTRFAISAEHMMVGK